MYDTVLVPTDGGDHALRAAEHAGTLARAFDATVHVLGVVDVQAAGGAFDVGGVDREFVEHLEERARDRVETTVGSVRGEDTADDGDGLSWEDVEEVNGDAGAAGAAAADGEVARSGVEWSGTGRIRTAVVRGTRSDAILDYAEEYGADLIAMGTHGRTGVKRFVSGSVTERVLRRSPVPVLTARAVERPANGDGYDDVLVPVDGSDAAGAAVDHVLAIAGAFDARVHALNVVEVGGLVTDADTAPSPGVFNRLESLGDEATGAVADRAREAGLDVFTEVREGSSGKAILDSADEQGIDLIAMGTHGRSGLERILLGSTTERIVRRADSPVLAVRPREEVEE